MKKTMKSVLTALVLMAAVTVYVYAQPRGGMTPEERAAMMAQRMKSELNLDDAQFEAVKRLNLSVSQPGDRQDTEARKKAMKQRDEELQKILTPEQFSRWQELRKGRPQGHGTMQRPAASDEEMTRKRVERMKQELSLTDAQAAELAAIYRDFSAQHKRDAEKRREDFAAHDEAVKKVLTPEQYAKMKELWKERRKSHRPRQ